MVPWRVCGRNGRGTVFKNRKAKSVVEGGKGICKTSFSRGRSVSKKSIQGKSNHVAILRSDIIWKVLARDRLVNIDILPSINSTKKETGGKARDMCLFPHHKVDEQPNRKPKNAFYSPKKKRKRRLGCCGYCEKLYHNWVLSRKARMRCCLKVENSTGETRCNKSWDRFEKYVSLSLRYVKQVSGKRKDHRLEKYKCQTSASAKSVRREIWGSVCPEHGLETCQKHASLKKNTKLHSTRLRKSGYSWLRQQKRQKKESLWWIPERVCTWSANETLTLLSWRPWGHRGVRRRWWRPTTRCKQEKKWRYMSKNWTCSSRSCFLMKLPQFFLSGSSARVMGFLPVDQRSRTTSHRKGQENGLQYI